MKKVVAIILVLILVFALSSCNSAEKLTEYELGDDKVASINAVLGESRTVSGVESGITNGVQYKQYTYKTTSMVDDLATYSTYLQQKGWLPTVDYNFNDGNGEAQLGKNSIESGKILIISIAFTSNSYAIRINKLEGTLTPT